MNGFNPVTLQRGTDYLAVVENKNPKTLLASKAGELAVAAFSDFPQYPVDGVGATLIFQTESGTYTLGGIRSNPCLAREKTKLDIDFPSQITTTIGGKLMDGNKTLREATIDAIAYKMFYDGDASQEPLMKLFDQLEEEKGWDARVCVHTDEWDNGTMCYITSVKRIQSTDNEISQLGQSLITIMEEKKRSGAEPRTLTDFRFQTLFPIVINAIDSHFKTEVEKALHAYQKNPAAVSVTFNDLSVTALAKAGAFDGMGSNFIHLAFMISNAVKEAFHVADIAKNGIKA